VTYANQSKSDWLGVSGGLIEEHGAVSEPVVLAMAAGAKRIGGCDYALAISGVAGPDGGTAQKPVGMVCIALGSPRGLRALTYNFPGTRDWIRNRSALMALSMLRYDILGRAMPR
jgi:nicotinamide-nucleotide amidase